MLGPVVHIAWQKGMTKLRAPTATLQPRVAALLLLGEVAWRSTMAAKKSARKYSKSASKNVEETMHERTQGTLRSGRSNKRVTSKKQAVAIGLSEARRAGKKVPPPKKGASKTKSS
jgi:hypothetical protein